MQQLLYCYISIANNCIQVVPENW